MEGQKRIRQACTPCKLRKRRCDGKDPCDVCVRLEDDCFYGTPRRNGRKRAQIVTAAQEQKATLQQQPLPILQVATPVSLQASSADTLSARIEERLSHIPGSKGLSAWNLGISQVAAGFGTSIDSLLRYKDLQTFSGTYFKVFNTVWGFLDENDYYKALFDRTWLVVNHEIDPILFGIALIGSYFHSGGPTELQAHLYKSLDNQLARYGLAEEPSLIIATALVLKVFYLRLTGSAYATWRTSCESLHVLETTTTNQECPAFVHREKLYAAANMAHFGISNESVRPTMRLLSFPTTNPSDLDRWEMHRLHDVYFRLSPGNQMSPDNLEDAIRIICEMEIQEDAARLCQASLAFAFFRHLRFQTENVPLVTLMRVLDLGSATMIVARRLVEKRLPWWNLLDVPFQHLCAILVIDCPVSLKRVRDALDTIKAVVSAFPSSSSDAVLERAQKMVSLIRKRKHEEAGILDRGLGMDDGGDDHTNGHADGQIEVAGSETPALAWGSLDWYNFDETMLPRFDFDLTM